MFVPHPHSAALAGQLQSSYHGFREGRTDHKMMQNMYTNESEQ
jgi:hypothetical protein